MTPETRSDSLRTMRWRLRPFLVGIVVAACGTAGILVACADAPAVTSTRCKGARCARDASDTSDGSAGSDDASAPTVETACADVAAAYCAQIERCYAFYGEFDRPEEECIARRKLSCELMLTAPGTNETPERVALCARDRRAFACDDAFAGKAPESCAPLSGALDDGKACVTSAQCKNKLCHYAASDSACGVCTKLPELGEDCRDVGTCAVPSWCIAGTCTALTTAGGACTSGDVCPANLTCIDGQCAPPLAAGATCSVTSDLCDYPALRCNTKSKVCTETIPAPAGGQCGTNASGDYSVCTGGSSCLSGPDGGVPKCVPPAADGTSCNTTNGPLCSLPARCVSGFCALPNPAACQ
ncbi:MAG TPA: hypothetical protein VM925_30225 [Labilithrix sp.]|nr:hypothetical protein [Labilithrix sp.]